MKVSVIITAYNREKFLQRAINSIRGDAEKILVTNLKDPNVKGVDKIVYSEEKNFGKFIIDAYEESTGDIIAFLNDDDEFIDGKIAITKANDEVIFFRHGLVQIYDNKRKEKKIGIDCEDKIKAVRYFPAIYNDTTISVKRYLIEENKRFLKNIKRSVDSALFSLAIDSDEPIRLISTPYSIYHIHKENTSVRKTGPLSDDDVELYSSYLHDRMLLYNKVKNKELKKILEREIEFYKSVSEALNGRRYKSKILKYNIINLLLLYFWKVRWVWLTKE